VSFWGYFMAKTALFIDDKGVNYDVKQPYIYWSLMLFMANYGAN
jgi:hypothetical protein